MLKKLKTSTFKTGLFALIVLFSFCFNQNVFAATADEIEDLIAGLQAEISEYQQKIADLQSRIVSLQAQVEVMEDEEWCHDFKYNLRYGLRGNEILALQKALQKEGFDLGSDLSESYFKTKTFEAVMSFQEKYKEEILDPWRFSAGTGYVGATTRQKLNELYGCTQVEKEIPTEESVEVEEPEEIVQEEVTEEEVTEEVLEEETVEIPEGTVCFDSDGGKDYYAKGYVTTDEGETKEWDSCRYFYSETQSVDMVFEAYCEGGELKVEQHQCLLGCMNSVCIEHRKADLSVVSLSLLPKEPLTTETMKVEFEVENSGNMESLDPFSVNCMITDKEGGVFFTGTSTIEEVFLPEEKKTLTFNINKAFEKEGDYNLSLFIDSDLAIYESGEINNKAELDFFVTKKQFCADSDSGRYLYSKGYTTMDEGQTKSWDVCSYDKTSKTYWVKETYCKDNLQKVESYSCPTGCLDGACIKEQLVAWWSFDDENNIGKDGSLNDLGGILVRAASLEGKKGNAAYFDGSSYIEVPDNNLLDLNGEGTIEMWVKYGEGSSGGVVLSKCKSNNSFGGCNYALKMENPQSSFSSLWLGDGNPGFADSCIYSVSGTETGVWYFVTATFDGQHLKIYVNGELKRSVPRALTNEIGVNDFSLVLGGMTCSSFADCNHFKGALDEVKIYNYALSDSEIKEHYEQ